MMSYAHGLTWRERIGAEHAERALNKIAYFLGAVEGREQAGRELSQEARQARSISYGALGALMMAHKGPDMDGFRWRPEYGRRIWTRRAAYNTGVRRAFALIEDVLASRVCGCVECEAKVAVAQFEADDMARAEQEEGDGHGVA